MITIRPGWDADGAALAALYNYYVVNTVTTFEVLPVSGEEMSRRVAAVQQQELPWLVAERDAKLVGYACAVAWKSRDAYRHSCESTIYLAPDHGGKGWGSRLYTRLIEELRARQLHTVIAGIAQPNDASVALHEKLGYHKVAHFSEVGFKFDRWVDVAYWQLLL